MEETTFPAHVNDPVERVRHQQNIRIAIAEELSLTDQWRFGNAIFSRKPKRMKARKLIGRLIAFLILIISITSCNNGYDQPGMTIHNHIGLLRLQKKHLLQDTTIPNREELLKGLENIKPAR